MFYEAELPNNSAEALFETLRRKWGIHRKIWHLGSFPRQLPLLNKEQLIPADVPGTELIEGPMKATG